MIAADIFILLHRILPWQNSNMCYFEIFSYKLPAKYILDSPKVLYFKRPKHRVCRLKNIWRLIKCSYFPAQWPFSKEHLRVSLSINICPPDASDKLSPKGEKVGKGRKWFCPHLPSRIKNATDGFFSRANMQCFPLPVLCQIAPRLPEGKPLII